MKNSLLLFICLFVSVHLSYAQPFGVKAGLNSFGVKAGLNLSTIGGDSEGVATKAGIHFGAFTQLGLTDLFKIQAELIYSQQGAGIDDLDDAKFNYNYLNIPIIVKFYPGGGGFNVHAGLQTGFVLSAELSTPSVDVDVKDDLEVLDFSLAVGIGFDINKIVIDARFIPGLTTTAEGPGDDSFPNQNIQLSLGIVF